MTVKEFLKELEHIKKTCGFDRFDFYARRVEDPENFTRVFMGKYDPDKLYQDQPEGSIESKSRSVVEIYSNPYEDWFEEGLYDTIEKIKEAFARANVRDSAKIELIINRSSKWKPRGYEYGGWFNIVKVAPTISKQKNVVVLRVDKIK